MNISGIYSDSIRSSEKSDQLKEIANKKQIELQQFDSDTKVAHTDWLQNPVTKKFFLNLKALQLELEERATQQAVSYPTHTNHSVVIKLLTQSATLNDIIKQYGRSNNNS